MFYSPPLKSLFIFHFLQNLRLQTLPHPELLPVHLFPNLPADHPHLPLFRFIDLEVVVSCHAAESQNQDCCHCTHIGFADDVFSGSTVASLSTSSLFVSSSTTFDVSGCGVTTAAVLSLSRNSDRSFSSI